jgi:hypothetical protein
MELGTLSILVQLLLILVLVALFAGRRWMRLHRQRRDSAPVAQRPASAATPPALAVPPAPVLADLPLAMRRTQAPPVPSLVSEELLPPCFADTCADWAQVGPAPAQASSTRFSLADWSAATDHVALDTTPDPATLDWALDAQIEPPRVPRSTAVRGGRGAVSCTIAPPAHHCA